MALNGNIIHEDKVEIICEQLLALSKLWDIILEMKDDFSEREIVEELLLEVLQRKQMELKECLG